MGYYFDDRDSAAWMMGNEPEKVIRLMAAKYMGDNPAEPFVWRTYDRENIACDRKGWFIFDFDRRFPEGENGEILYAAGDLFCPEEKVSGFQIRCFGPCRVWVNGESIFVSNGNQERDGQPVRFEVSLREGYNRFLIRFERTAIGFGGRLRNAAPQWEPCSFIMPFLERGGEAGFLFTSPLLEEVKELTPFFGNEEKAVGLTLLPGKREPIREEGGFYAWFCLRAEKKTEILPGTVLLNGKRPENHETIPAGKNELLLYGTLEELRTVLSGVKVTPPLLLHGASTPYLVLGPCAETREPEKILDPGTVYSDTVWRPDLENMLLRPYLETNLFAKWSYPLGVTLYGLLSAGRLLKEPFFTQYVHEHVQQVTHIQKRALWEREHLGFSGVNQQLCWLDALDDCGSFASLMLEEDGASSEEVRAIADRVAEYMMKEQPRTEEGAFCRRDGTMWVDDMYMSVPFLCRYALLFDHKEAMDLCAEELLHFRTLLYMPEKKLMAHMLCLNHGMNNHIPWSRGNGWVIFSLSELLMRLPKDHLRRAELEHFFTELTEGYLACQGETGLWHQVLDDAEAYPESSSTAMMICAFCRGIRMGLYTDPVRRQAAASVKKAWEGLTSTAVDRKGNLYGVCRGSGFSFSRAYYRSLMWRFNDTHGIGIVMLAGTEMMKTELDV